jgi:hypothetical protein
MNKFTSGATTSAGVALANFNSVLWVAFAGGGGLGAAAPNYKLNIMPVERDNPTDAWSFERLLVLESETTMEQPALAAFGGKLWLAWTGTDAAHRIYMMPLSVDSDNRLTAAGPKQPMPWTATGGPSLAVRHVWANGTVKQQLYMSFCASGSGELNFAFTNDGASWSNVVWNNYHSLLTPSLTEIPVGAGLPTEPPDLFVGFKGTDSRLYLLGPTDHAALTGLENIANHDPETSDYAPSVGAFNNVGTWTMFYVWTGSGSNRHLYCQEGIGFSSQNANSHTAYSDTSAFAPSVLGIDWHRYVAWAGTDNAHRLNIAELSTLQPIPS